MKNQKIDRCTRKCLLPKRSKNTTTSVNGTETTSPAEGGTVVEGVTKVTYIYEKAGSVIVNYKTEDGTPLTGTVVGDESKT